MWRKGIRPPRVKVAVSAQKQPKVYKAISNSLSVTFGSKNLTNSENSIPITAIWDKITFHASKGKVLVTDKIEEYIKQNNIYAEDSETEMAKFLEDRKNLHKWEIDFKDSFHCPISEGYAVSDWWSAIELIGN